VRNRDAESGPRLSKLPDSRSPDWRYDAALIVFRRASAEVLVLVLVFFLTSVVSVVTGSTSLITVPVMIAVGIEPHIAVATNMMALIFMSVGGSLPFARKGVLERRLLPLSIVLTLIGSAIGAFLLLHVPVRALQATIAVAMIAVAVFTLAKKDSGTNEHVVSNTSAAVGYVATFALAGTETKSSVLE
jgi:uncharacterized membrane protein YfcA